MVEERLPKGYATTAVAVAPLWLTVLFLVADSDAIATVPRRGAERMAEVLRLQVLDGPFEPWSFPVSMIRRAARVDAGAEWLAGEVRRAFA